MQVTKIFNNKISHNNTTTEHTQKFKFSDANFLLPIKQDQISFSGLHTPTILRKVETFGLKEYNALTKNEIKTLRNSLDEKLIRDRDTIIMLAEIVKKNLEKKFPEGYVFVSIGNSPNIIAKALEHQRVDVKYCPVSELKMEQSDFIHNIKNRGTYQRGLEVYKNYLDEIGLSQKDINDSNKKICFIDYTFTGNSLKNFETMLNSPEIKLNSPKFKFLSLNNDLILHESGDDYAFLNKIIENKFEIMDLKDYADYKTISLNTIYSAFDIKNRKSSDLPKLMDFAIIDKYKKEGIID